jgi:hypothetical protein
MPRQRRQPNGAPYTRLFSSLRKPDLIRLCVEFRLASVGSVITLKERLRDYINLNRDMIYRNPRYRALFPRHQNPGRRASPPDSDSIGPSPPPSNRSLSPASSDDSWHGIGGPIDNGAPAEDHAQHPFEHHPFLQPDQPPEPQHPQVQLDVQPIHPNNLPQEQQPFIPDNPYDPIDIPFPPLSVVNSNRGSPPVVGSEYYLRGHRNPPSRLILLLFDTMKSICKRHYAVS